MLARTYGIRPWELERLSWWELRAILDDIDDTAKAARAAKAKAKAGR